MGKVLAMETGEMRRAREISRIILEADEFVREATREVLHLTSEFSRLKEDIAFFEMEQDVRRELELSGMTVYDPRHGLGLVT